MLGCVCFIPLFMVLPIYWLEVDGFGRCLEVEEGLTRRTVVSLLRRLLPRVRWGRCESWDGTGGNGGVYVGNAMASKHISLGIFSYSRELEIDSNR